MEHYSKYVIRGKRIKNMQAFNQLKKFYQTQKLDEKLKEVKQKMEGYLRERTRKMQQYSKYFRLFSICGAPYVWWIRELLWARTSGPVRQPEFIGLGGSPALVFPVNFLLLPAIPLIQEILYGLAMTTRLFMIGVLERRSRSLADDSPNRKDYAFLMCHAEHHSFACSNWRSSRATSPCKVCGQPVHWGREGNVGVMFLLVF